MESRGQGRIRARQALRKGQKGGGDGPLRPSLGHLLAGLPPADLHPYLVVREALLCLGDLQEAVLRDGDDWCPGFTCRGRQLLRVRFSHLSGLQGPAALLLASRDILLESSASTDLSPTTRRALRQAAAGAPGAAAVLPLRGERGTAEVVAAAMLLRARIAAAPSTSLPVPGSNS